jgi:hypothetical protein
MAETLLRAWSGYGSGLHHVIGRALATGSLHPFHSKNVARYAWLGRKDGLNAAELENIRPGRPAP